VPRVFSIWQAPAAGRLFCAVPVISGAARLGALAAALAVALAAQAGGGGGTPPSNPGGGSSCTPGPKKTCSCTPGPKRTCPTRPPSPPPPSAWAEAGPNQTVDEGSAVRLSGSGNGAMIWSRVSGPAVSLRGASTATPTFTAPELTSNGSLVFRLRVTHSRTSGGRTVTTRKSDTVRITVRADDDPPRVTAGGRHRRVSEGALVTLSGSGTDDGGSLEYRWAQVSGVPEVELSGAETARATFTAPRNLRATTAMAFRLTVTDSAGQTATDTTVVTVADVGSGAARVSFTTRPASGDTYGLGETIGARVTFDEPLAVTGSPRLGLTVGSRTRSMSYAGAGRGRVLDFEYRVQASDRDADGVSIGAGALTLPSGTTLTARGNRAVSASLRGLALPDDGTRKVDGSWTNPDFVPSGRSLLTPCAPAGR